MFLFHYIPEKRLEFEKRRKLHYNEGEALKLARKLIEEDEDEDEDAGNLAGASSSSATNVNQTFETLGSGTTQGHLSGTIAEQSRTTPTIEIDMESDRS